MHVITNLGLRNLEVKNLDFMSGLRCLNTFAPVYFRFSLFTMSPFIDAMKEKVSKVPYILTMIDITNGKVCIKYTK